MMQIRMILLALTLRYIFLSMFRLEVIWVSVSMSLVRVRSRDSRCVSRSSIIPIPTSSVSAEILVIAHQ